MRPKVCIVILNWNGRADTTECLESLQRTTYPEYKVIVVDNGSSGNDVNILREQFGSYIHIIENDKNYGFAEGNNIGIRYAVQNFSPDYLLLLNNDAVVNPDCVTELVQVAESDPKLGIAGPKIRFYDAPQRSEYAGGLIRWWSGAAVKMGFGQLDKGQFDQTKEVDWVIGCALLIKRELIERIGLLYPVYFMNWEEVDWCARCKKEGYRVVYVPKAVLWHKGGRSSQRVSGMNIYYMTRNRFLFMRRNATRLQFVSFLAWFFLRDVLVTTASLYLQYRDTKSVVTFFKGTRDGIRLSLRRSDVFLPQTTDSQDV